MKKLFTLFTLVLVAVMFNLTASAGYIRPQPEEYTKLLDVDITLNFPIGEIKDDKLVYTRKDVQIKGIVESIAGYSSNDPAKRIPENASYRETFYWMTSRTFLAKEAIAKQYNEFNRAHGGSSTVGKQESVMSYPNSFTITPTFSALGETASKGGFTFKFRIPRGNFQVREETTDKLNLSYGEFGYGHDDVTVTLSGELTASGGKIQSGSGVVVATVEYEVPSDSWRSYFRFDGFPYIQRTGNRFHTNGWGTFTIKARPYTNTWPSELEQYFYQKYDYNGVELLDRIYREAAERAAKEE